MPNLQTVLLSILVLSSVAILFMYNSFFSATPYFDLMPEVEKQALTSPTPIPTSTPQPIPQVQKVYQFDCTGPDGAVFKITQKECDELNQALSNLSSTGHTKDQLNDCLSETFDKKDNCQFQCHATRAWEHDNCSDSYSGSNALIENNQQKYNACVSESVAKHLSCFTSCSQQHDPFKCTY